jgi:HSP20 family protein
MPPERDVFADFARMRREIDELFGDAWERAGYAPRTGAGFCPRVDVYYGDDPARAVIKVDLAGVDPGGVSLELNGRQLTITGQRPVQETEGRVYQQLEIDSGPFRRVVELGADVVADQAKATYRDGVLRIELPLEEGRDQTRRVPIERSRSSQE